MAFVWDEEKRAFNVKKHEIDFEDAETIFDGTLLTFEDDRFDYGEERYITLGLLRGEVVVIVHTERDDDTRIISMRSASKYEQQIFYEEFSD